MIRAPRSLQRLALREGERRKATGEVFGKYAYMNAEKGPVSYQLEGTSYKAVLDILNSIDNPALLARVRSKILENDREGTAILAKIVLIYEHAPFFLDVKEPQDLRKLIINLARGYTTEDGLSEFINREAPELSERILGDPEAFAKAHVVYDYLLEQGTPVEEVAAQLAQLDQITEEQITEWLSELPKAPKAAGSGILDLFQREKWQRNIWRPNKFYGHRLYQVGARARTFVYRDLYRFSPVQPFSENAG